MADYYSLLANLLDGLPDATPARRRGVYDRARRALSDQLRNVTPALTDSDVRREELSLEEAIRQLETRYGDTRNPEPEPQPEIVAKPARRPEPPEDSASDLSPEPIAIRRGGRRQRPTALLVTLLLLAVPVAVLAWMWRDQPRGTADSAAQQAAPAAPAASAPPGDNKIAERIGGPPGPPPPNRAARIPSAPVQPGPGPDARGQSAAPGPAQGDVAVAQRALIFEENLTDPQQPSISTGRALWRLDTVSAGQGMALETVIRGTVELAQAGLTLNVLIRRNLDPALPASHTIELTFLNAPVSGTPPRTVRDVALPMMRPEETIRGVSVAGLPVPVKENVFLIGLSDLKGDIERNAELLLRRNWMELPIRFASGQKAALLFDKGVSGERVFYDAFRHWGQVPPQ
jgi:hypothetical protein